MTKLNCKQTAILANAANLANGSVLPLPEGMAFRGGALNAVLRAMERRGLLQRSSDNNWTLTKTGHIAAAETGKDAKLAPSYAAPATSTRDRKTLNDDKANSDNERPTVFRSGTRQAQLLEMLHRDKGADIDEMVQVTGWQQHSIRAVLTGFRKRGIEVTRTKEGNGVSVYHAPVPATATKAAS